MKTGRKRGLFSVLCRAPFKQGIGRVDLAEGEDVRDQRGGVQLARGDQPQDLGAVAAIHAAGLEGQVFAVHLGQGQHLRPVIQRDDGHDRVRPRALPRHAEALLRARDLEHHVRAAVGAVLPDEFQHMPGRYREHIRVVLLHEAAPRGVGLAQNQPPGLA